MAPAAQGRLRFRPGPGSSSARTSGYASSPPESAEGSLLDFRLSRRDRVPGAERSWARRSTPNVTSTKAFVERAQRALARWARRTSACAYAPCAWLSTEGAAEAPASLIPAEPRHPRPHYPCPLPLGSAARALRPAPSRVSLTNTSHQYIFIALRPRCDYEGRQIAFNSNVFSVARARPGEALGHCQAWLPPSRSPPPPVLLKPKLETEQLAAAEAGPAPAAWRAQCSFARRMPPPLPRGLGARDAPRCCPAPPWASEGPWQSWGAAGEASGCQGVGIRGRVVGSRGWGASPGLLRAPARSLPCPGTWVWTWAWR